MPIQEIFSQRLIIVERMRRSGEKAKYLSEAVFASLQHRAFQGEL
jgi:hypothetical protein